jgi:hypothetical protein
MRTNRHISPNLVREKLRLAVENNNLSTDKVRKYPQSRGLSTERVAPLQRLIFNTTAQKVSFTQKRGDNSVES